MQKSLLKLEFVYELNKKLRLACEKPPLELETALTTCFEIFYKHEPAYIGGSPEKELYQWSLKLLGRKSMDRFVEELGNECRYGWA